MPNDDHIRSKALIAVAIRFATWTLPAHRKSWAKAMFNEIAYVPSQRAALHWILECTLSAIRERAAYEMERTFMHHKTFKTLLRLGAASVIAVAGLYAVQKPYQRERITITFHKIFDAKHAPIGK